MKKLLFSAHSLEFGGIETALVSLLNNIDYTRYEVTLVLEDKSGPFLDVLNKNVEIVEYSPYVSENLIKRKVVNLLNRIKFLIKYKNKFDFSASFATYSLAGSFVARVASKNSYLWAHADYKALYKGDSSKLKNMFNKLNVEKFSKIIFVSNEGRKTFLESYPKLENKTMVCNNLIDGNRIIEKSEEIIDLKRDDSLITFINVGRFDELQKKLSRIIEASKRLKEDGIKFRVLLVGDGQDRGVYEDLISKYDLSDCVFLLGFKINPYPYFKIADINVISSDYEGYPVVFIESMIIKLPIITTDVSDSRKDIDGNFGIVVEKDNNSIYRAMKNFSKERLYIKKEFDIDSYNNKIIEKLKEIFDKEIK